MVPALTESKRLEQDVEERALNGPWSRRACGGGHVLARRLDGRVLVLGVGATGDGDVTVVVTEVRDWADRCSGA